MRRRTEPGTAARKGGSSGRASCGTHCERTGDDGQGQEGRIRSDQSLRNPRRWTREDLRHAQEGLLQAKCVDRRPEANRVRCREEALLSRADLILTCEVRLRTSNRDALGHQAKILSAVVERDMLTEEPVYYI